MDEVWKKSSWRIKKKHQMPDYEDKDQLNKVVNSLCSLPPLVFAGEVRNLKNDLARVESGKAFLLQGGDCAESFEEFSADLIRDTFKVLLKMAVVLTFGGKKPVVKIGRMAGQFAKPRSSDFEIINGQKLPSYRGDIINDISPTVKDRIPNPERMLKAYTQSSASLNLLRAFSQGGFADISRVHSWVLESTKGEDGYKKFFELATKITNALEFMSAAGVNSNNSDSLSKVDFYTSHEALLLEYEEALCREDSTTGLPVAGSGHMIWIGDRTRQIDGAHVEFCKGVQNPIGLKCGPSLDPDELVHLCQILNPKNEPGRLTLITRFGSDKIAEHLPKIIKAVNNAKLRTVWCCDPMHGNTIKASNGYKTRRVAEILNEVNNFFLVHKSEGTLPGGVHFEMTGSNVTECLGGANEVKESDLGSRYHTHCDPRLNGSQSLELAFLVSDLIKSFRNGKGS